MPDTEIEEALKRELIEEIKADLDLACECINGREFREQVTLPVCAICRLENQGKVKEKF
jgi:hypothetical protein